MMADEITTTQAPESGQVTREQNETQKRQSVRPVVRIYEEDEAWMLEAEMPGVTRDNVQINTEDTELTIVGRKSDTAVEDAKVLYRESHSHDYRRVFELHPSVDTSRIKARMESGLLKVTLPKAERVKPRSIQVTD
jgi:HSP20 family molecular chaperone IbpA